MRILNQLRYAGCLRLLPRPKQPGDQSRARPVGISIRVISREETSRRGFRRDGSHWSDDGFCVPVEGHFVQLIGYQRQTDIRDGKRGSLFTNAKILKTAFRSTIHFGTYSSRCSTLNTLVIESRIKNFVI